MGKQSRWLWLFGILVVASMRAWAAVPDAAELRLIEATERSLDGAPALALIFSAELDPKSRYDEFLTVADAEGRPVPGAWVVGDNARFLYFPGIQPKTTYTVLVRRGLPAADGSVLPAHVERTISTRAIEPSFGFASQGSVLPARLTEGLPIVTVNVPAVDVEFLKVRSDRIGSFIRDVQQAPSTDYYALDRMRGYSVSVYLARFKTNAPANKRTVTHLAVEDIEELQAPGLYVAVMRQPGRFEGSYKTSFFFVSDIGLQARRYRQGLDVFASSLATAAALVDVELHVYDRKNRIAASGFTDVRGQARLDLAGVDPVLLTAEHGGHISLVPFNRPALDLSEFAVDGRPNEPVEVFLFGPRDLYRPGETVLISGLLRDQDGRAVPEQPLTARLKRPDGRVIRSFTWQPQDLGYYAASLPLLPEAQTGTWTLEVRTDPASEQPSAVYRFLVEEFLPERLQLDLAADPGFLRPSQPFAIHVQGAYLYGAPAAGNRLKAAATVSRDPHPLDSLPDVFFGDADDDEKQIRQDLPEIDLDDEGRGTIEFLPLESVPASPMKVKVAANLYELGGRPVTRSIERTLWPAEALVGIRPLFDPEHVDGDTTLEFEVLRCDVQGNKVPGRDLAVSLIHEDRDYYWVYTDEAGWVSRYNPITYSLFEDTLSLDAGASARVRAPVKYGQYRLEVKDPETGLTARFRFRAGWWYVAGPETKPAAKPDRVELRLDRASYRPGQTARVTVVPPHAGEAVVTVEADRLLWSERRAVGAEGAVFEIPIGADWQRHDLYVSAVVFRPAGAEDRTTPNRAMGVLHLPLDRADRKLALSIDAPAGAKSGKPLSVSVRVGDRAGAQAYVTLAAVDVGVLNITDFETPDPFAYFFARRRYGVDVYDLYGQVIERLSGVRATPRFGGGEDRRPASKGAHAKVQIVSLFSGPVAVDASGQASITLPLPEFNGRLRLMALAFSADRFAAAQSEVTVVAPVVAEISMARFLGSGDRSRLTLELHNMSGKDQRLDVRLAATPPLVLAAEPQVVALRDQQKTVLGFPLSGADAFGVGTIELSVQGEGVALRRRWELGVRPPYPGERRTLEKRLAPGESLEIDPAMAAGLMALTVDGSLLASDTPMLNLKGALKGLLRYPYGCLEQTTSSAFPIIYADPNVVQRMGLDPLTYEERRKRLDVAFARLAGMQLASGGFGLWNDRSPEEAWLSAYVAEFLLEARKHGFDSPEEMLKRVLDRLTQQLQSSGTSLSVHVSQAQDAASAFASRAYAAYVLARLNRAPLGTLRTLYDHRGKDPLSPLALAQLGVALYLEGDTRRGLEALEAAVAAPRPDVYLADYGSHLRDTAIILRLLARYGIDLPAADDLAFRLRALAVNRRWLSTQERNALFLAALSSGDGEGAPWQAGLRIRGQTQQVEVPGVLRRSLTAQDIAAGVDLTSHARFPVYAEVEVTGYPVQPPAAELKPVRVERTFYTLEGAAAEARELASGDMLLVHLAVTSEEDIEHGLLVDLIPAGLEIENQNLAQSERLSELVVDGIDIGDALANDDIKHVEYREDRFVAAVRLYAQGTMHLYYLVRAVTPGVYRVPPTSFEDMYAPETRAVGETRDTLTVREPAR